MLFRPFLICWLVNNGIFVVKHLPGKRILEHESQLDVSEWSGKENRKMKKKSRKERKEGNKNTKKRKNSRIFWMIQRFAPATVCSAPVCSCLRGWSLVQQRLVGNIFALITKNSSFFFWTIIFSSGMVWFQWLDKIFMTSPRDEFNFRNENRTLKSLNLLGQTKKKSH